MLVWLCVPVRTQTRTLRELLSPQEDAARLADMLGDATPLADVAAARLMVPPTPVMREDNWPLLTVSKGFFETLAVKGEWPRGFFPRCG
jgi:hypothetical protein